MFPELLSLTFLCFSKGRNGISLERILMHELGHALGLEHVNGSETIMNPYYDIFSQHSKPQANDISGIKKLYGKLQVTFKPLSYHVLPSRKAFAILINFE